MATVFKIYYTDPVSDVSHSHDVETLSEALRYTEGFRKLGMTFVTMVSENTDLVGKPGVAGVVDGKLPTGETYTYTKGDALSQRTKKPAISTDNLEVPLDE